MLKAIVPVLALALAAAMAMPAHATENAKQLINSNGCRTCHQDKTKLVGPAFGWVAYHFKGKKDAVETVADFIINGGTGYWVPWTGNIPMPSHPNLSKAQAKTIAKYILNLPPVKPPPKN
ncbi:MAG TPA: c-type cytochrome [Gammaproteobacteria bacterium]|nr:c-type cytochrome [Gammaproteobacteria bacterium]